MASTAPSSRHPLSPTLSPSGVVDFNTGQWIPQTDGHAQGVLQEPQATSKETQQARNSRQSVSVACVPCRSRHLKCGGGERCSRCVNEGLKCTYIKSRRGFKGPRRNKNAIHHGRSDNSEDISGESQKDPSSASPRRDSIHLDSLSNLSPTTSFESTTRTLMGMGQIPPPFSPTSLQVQSILTAPPSPVQTANVGKSSSFNAFYAYFQAAHPFVLPRTPLMNYLKVRSLSHLEKAVNFVGSTYLGHDQAEILAGPLYQTLFNESIQKDGFTVQALLLFAVGTHMNGNPEKSSTIMDSAVDLALELGMNYNQFSIDYGEGDRVLEESWRRTWWELYVIDGMISASIQRPFFRLQSVSSTVCLPCEEAEYSSGNIPEPRTLDSFDETNFLGDDEVYSSFSYLIDAIRNLGKIMALSRGETFQLQEVELLETSITNFALHLPESKRELISKTGQFDEVLFQAHMVAAASSILLHRPRSNLIIEEIKNVKTCVKVEEALFPTQDRIVHSAQAIRAAETISRLSTLPTPLVKHSPFFTCMVTQAAVVHLSYWSFLVPETEDKMVKEQVRLDIGVLRTLSGMWPIGKRVLGQVRNVAREMFSARKEMNINPWAALSEEEIMQSLIEVSSDDKSVLSASSEQYQPVSQQ